MSRSRVPPIALLFVMLCATLPRVRPSEPEPAPGSSAPHATDGLAARLRRRALESRMRGDRDGEIAALRSALAAAPGDGGAIFALAVALGEQGQNDEAAKRFATLLDNEALRAPALAHLAELDRAASRNASEIDRRRRLSGERQDLPALLAFARSLRRTGLLRTELDHPPPSSSRLAESPAWQALTRAALLRESGRDREARSAALAALALDPVSETIRSGARWFSDRGRAADGWIATLAARAARGGVSPGDPSSGGEPGASLARAMLLRWQGKVGEALELVRGAAASHPESAAARTILGELLAADGAGTEASLGEMRRALEIDAGFAPAARALGRQQLDAGRGLDAEQTATAAIGADQDDAAAYRLLGQARLATGRPGEALSAFRSALFLDPHDLSGEGRLGLVTTLATLGRPEETRAFLTSLLPVVTDEIDGEIELFKAALPWSPRGERRERRLEIVRAPSMPRLDPSPGGSAGPAQALTIRVLADGSAIACRSHRAGGEAK